VGRRGQDGAQRASNPWSHAKCLPNGYFANNGPYYLRGYWRGAKRGGRSTLTCPRHVSVLCGNMLRRVSCLSARSHGMVAALSYHAQLGVIHIGPTVHSQDRQNDLGGRAGVAGRAVPHAACIGLSDHRRHGRSRERNGEDRGHSCCIYGCGGVVWQAQHEWREFDAVVGDRPQPLCGVVGTPRPPPASRCGQAANTSGPVLAALGVPQGAKWPIHRLLRKIFLTISLIGDLGAYTFCRPLPPLGSCSPIVPADLVDGLRPIPQSRRLLPAHLNPLHVWSGRGRSS
jgi:hypothetical protein